VQIITHIFIKFTKECRIEFLCLKINKYLHPVMHPKAYNTVSNGNNNKNHIKFKLKAKNTLCFDISPHQIDKFKKIY